MEERVFEVEGGVLGDFLTGLYTTPKSRLEMGDHCYHAEEPLRVPVLDGLLLEVPATHLSVKARTFCAHSSSVQTHFSKSIFSQPGSSIAQARLVTATSSCPRPVFDERASTRQSGRMSGRFGAACLMVTATVQHPNGCLSPRGNLAPDSLQAQNLPNSRMLHFILGCSWRESTHPHRQAIRTAIWRCPGVFVLRNTRNGHASDDACQKPEKTKHFCT